MGEIKRRNIPFKFEGCQVEYNENGPYLYLSSGSFVLSLEKQKEAFEAFKKFIEEVTAEEIKAANKERMEELDGLNPYK